MTACEVPVLIVGGGPIGFALGLELGYQGVRSLLVEQEPEAGGELLAKAGTLNERTLEFCRRWGIADQVANWGADESYPFDTVYTTALNGHYMGRDAVGGSRERQHRDSPEVMRKCPQHIFDPILAGAARAAGCEVRHGTRCRVVAQDADGVTAELTDVATGETSTIRAAWLVGCDGAASKTRVQSAIPFEGPTLDYSISAMLRIKDLDRHHPLGKATRYIFIGENGPWANLTSVDYGDLWRFMMFGSKEQVSADNVDFGQILPQAFGRDDIPFELLRVVPWRRSQCTAKTYRDGRIFLAGDAAHTTSPTGGHGLNTGMGDVIGLGWILASQVQGWGGPGLLDAYTIERRPVALRNGGASTKNYAGWTGRDLDYAQVNAMTPEGEAERRRIGEVMAKRLYASWIAQGIRLGYRYEDSPVVIAETTPEPPDPADTYVPTARPGHRAPHVWLAPDRSILDLFGHGFVLLRLGAGAPDTAALEAAARRRGLPLAVHAIANAEAETLYELPLVLVRPDGHVAWRSGDAPGQAAALAIIDRVRGASAPAQAVHTGREMSP